MSSAIRRRPKTNQERVEESTLALIASAIQLFARQGYERTTAVEIGTNAGFSRNMVRDRYGSKEALLQSVFDTFAELLLPALARYESTAWAELAGERSMGPGDDCRHQSFDEWLHPPDVLPGGQSQPLGDSYDADR